MRHAESQLDVGVAKCGMSMQGDLPLLDSCVNGLIFVLMCVVKTFSLQRVGKLSRRVRPDNGRWSVGELHFYISVRYGLQHYFAGCFDWRRRIASQWN